MSSLIYSFDIFGHQAKLNVDKQQKKYKTLIGVCFSVLYFLIAITIIFSCIQPELRAFIEGFDDKNESDTKTGQNRRRRNLASLASSSIFTSEPYIVAGTTPPKTNEPIGIFIFV